MSISSHLIRWATVLTFLSVQGSGLISPAEASSVTPRGYASRACGFDMDDDLIYGEPNDDCNVCDGVTTDPDGDGIAEDLFYVDCQTGTDNGSCGSPGSPCRTINHALNNRADGPGGGAEDIVCFRGTCSQEPASMVLTVSGLAGTKSRPKSGSEVRDFVYPSNPVMVVGWDSDNDRKYPPFDTGDTAVISANGDKGLLLNLSQNYVEFAHFSTQGYGQNPTGSGGQVMFDHDPPSSGANYFYFHDLEFNDFAKDRCYEGGTRVFANRRVRYQAVENVKCDDCGSFFWRGGATNAADYGPLRLQNSTHMCHAGNTGSPQNCGGSNAKCRLIDMWGFIGGVEIIDNVFDGNVDAWQEGHSSMQGITMADCAQDWDIVNNEIVDWRIGIQITASDNTFCADGRVTKDATIDRNIFKQGSPDYNNAVFLQIVDEGTEGSNRLSGEFIISNNLAYDYGGGRFGSMIEILSGIGNNESPYSGTIRILNNTFYVRNWVSLDKAFLRIEASDDTYEWQNYEVKNNSITAPQGGENFEIVPSPNSWDADFNTFSPNLGYKWNNRLYTNILDWRSSSGSDFNSNECVPAFSSPENNDFHLKAGDNCAKDRGANLGTILQIDFDGDPRGQGDAWDRGADEFVDHESFFSDSFESGSTNAWTATLP